MKYKKINKNKEKKYERLKNINDDKNIKLQNCNHVHEMNKMIIKLMITIRN